MKAVTMTILALSFCAQAGDAADKKDPTSDMVVTGNAVTKQEMDSAEPVATFGKEEIVSVLQTGKPACKNGSAAATFDGTTFAFGEERFTADRLVERLHQLKSAEKISCFHVRAPRYDKAVYTNLQHSLVDGNGISLFWDETK